MKGQLYTIGYSRLSPGQLRSLVVRLDATLIDCRYRPRSRRPGFSRTQLIEMLGPRYAWLAGELGGYGNVNCEGIASIRAMLRRGRNLVLLCAEEAPGDCHRHHAICAPHFPSAVHIFRNELIQARELQRSIVAGCDYEIFGSLSQRMRSSPLPCITVRPQWAEAIFHEGKDVENRPWYTHLRGRIAIHAGRPVSSIIGTVEIHDCVRRSRSRWAQPNCWHWLLRNPTRFAHPIPCRGRLGIYQVYLPKP